MPRIALILLLLGLAAQLASAQINSHKKLVCYYDARALTREGIGKMTVDKINTGLCDYYVYGHAKVDDDEYHIEAVDESRDLDAGEKLGGYRSFTNLKKSNANIKTLLGVGSYYDGRQDRYLRLIEDPAKRAKFISTTVDMLKKYNFDGVDLLWEFPAIKPKSRKGISGFFSGLRESVGLGRDDEDPQQDDIRKNGFSSLIREMKDAFKVPNFILAVSIPAWVNATRFYDVELIASKADEIHLLAYDYVTPENSPKDGDFPAPLYGRDRSAKEANPPITVQGSIKYWLDRGAPAQKLIVGIPTFGRMWELDDDVKAPIRLPVDAEGKGPAGDITQTPGLLAYYEICTRLKKRDLTEISDTEGQHGPSAYKIPYWVGYEDATSARIKAQYIRTKNLAGAFIRDITLDDFSGTCDATTYPITRAVKNGL